MRNARSRGGARCGASAHRMRGKRKGSERPRVERHAESVRSFAYAPGEGDPLRSAPLHHAGDSSQYSARRVARAAWHTLRIPHQKESEASTGRPHQSRAPRALGVRSTAPARRARHSTKAGRHPSQLYANGWVPVQFVTTPSVLYFHR